jgi:CheY-like chemotaxis protein
MRLSTGTVLVVDDYPINRRLTQLLLEKNGFEVRQAGTAAECLAELARELPDMILMDIGLPDMDGLVLTRKIRSDPRMARVIIVAYTGYAMVGDQERILARGFDGYIPKPVDRQRLIAEVKHCLQVGSSKSA